MKKSDIDAMDAPQGVKDWMGVFQEGSEPVNALTGDVTSAPKLAPRSLNGRFIVESYKEDRGLKATVTNGFAMVQQKVSLKGLKLLADAQNTSGQYIARKGDMVYIRESLLQAQPWAKATFTSDAIDGEFMIVDQTYIEFVDQQ